MSRSSLTLLLLIVVLAACAVPPAPAPTAAPAQPAVTLTFAAFERDREAYAAAIETFNAANPDLRVQFVPLEEALSGVRRGRAPERVAAFTGAIAGAADTAALFGLFPEEQASPAFQDLTPFVEADPQFDRGAFFPAALPPVGTPLTALPVRIEPPLLAYNQGLWEQQGLLTPAADWSWSDLLAALDQLVASGDDAELRGLLNNRLDSLAITALLGQLTDQGVVFTEEQTPQLDTPVVAAALEQTVERVRSRALPAPLPAQGSPADDPVAAVVANQAGLWPLELDAGSNDERELGWALFPHGAVVEAVAVQTLVMSAGTAQPDAAWRWLSFLSQQELPPPGNTALGPAFVPALRSQLEASPAWRTASDAQRAVLAAVLERPLDPTDSRLATRRVVVALAAALRAVLDEGQSPEAALADAQASLAAASAGTSTEVAAAPAVATPLPTPAVDVTTIRYLVYFQDEQLIKPYIDSFETANPGIRVELRQFAGPTDFSFQSFSETADLFFWWDDALAQPEIGAAALDLQPLIDADLAFNLADYPAGLLGLYRNDGRLYGLPQSVYLAHIGYNADLFAATGVPVPAPGWTVDEFVALANQFASNPEGATRYGFTSTDIAEGLTWFVASRRAPLVLGEGDELRPNYSDPQVRAALQEGLDLIRTASPRTYINYSPATYNRVDTSHASLVGGSVAMWWDAGFSFSPNVDQPTFQRGMLPLPLDSAGIFDQSFSTVGLHISAKTAHPDAAWRLLKFLSTEVPTRYSGFPARTSLAESEAFREAAPLGAAEVYAAYKPLLSQPLPERLWYQLWRVNSYWLFRAADRALQGGDLEQELDDAQFFTEQYLACVRGGERAGVCARQVDPSYDGELEP